MTGPPPTSKPEYESIPVITIGIAAIDDFSVSGFVADS
jgi:hypothetical protein